MALGTLQTSRNQMLFSSLALIQLDFTAVTVPGLLFQVTGDQVIYENELVASRDVKTGGLGSVTRDSAFR